MSAATVFFLRHAESLPSREIDPADWPLSRSGQAVAHQLAHSLGRLRIDALYCSPYSRAIDTLRPYAESTGKHIEIVDDFREQRLTTSFTESFLLVAERSWTERSFALAGCESAQQACLRFSLALETVSEKNPGKTLLVCSHGIIISLFINSILPRFGFTDWRDMLFPALYEVHVEQGEYISCKDSTKIVSEGIKAQPHLDSFDSA